jgi:subtilisin family serine protease
MKSQKIFGKGVCLVCILLASVFFFANISQSEEIERIQCMGDKRIIRSTQKKVIQSQEQEGKSILIRLGHAHFDPLKTLPPEKPRINDLKAFKTGETGYYIIQFDGPVKKDWKQALIDTGAEIFDYIPDFAFIIRLDPVKETTARNLPHVRWLGIYQPSYRISQAALDKSFAKTAGAEDDEKSSIILRVNAFPGEDIDRIRADINTLGGTVLDEVSTKWKTTLKVKILKDQIPFLPPISGIKWIEPVPEWKLFNNKSADVMSARNVWDTYGLYGQGVTVAVCDTGLDQGSMSPASLHDDFEDGAGSSRVTAIFELAGDGASSDVNSGHGTHVAGSVLGNGYLSGGNPGSNSFPSTCYAGMAPKANLVFQAVEDNSSGSLSGLPADLNTLFSQADGAGAHLHTNSWGSSMSGMYTAYSQDVDEYVWDNPDFLILFSAGNDGIDMDGDGVIDYYSMGSPGTAKNCLTVGASEGDRPSGAGYDFAWATGSWAVKYSADPIKSDHVSDNTNGMAAFSSRGPCLDARFKPDIVAPGTNIASTRSSAASETGWGIIDANYLWMGGTSMATPLTAGAAALTREHLINKGHTNPSAALIKGTMINSAEDISPGQYGTGSTQEIPNSPVPNYVEGWGRMNCESIVSECLTPPISHYRWDVQSSLDTGEYDEYEVKVSDSGTPLKINLVWTDYPGSPSAQGGLVNDLDLQVTDPSATIHYPDNASQKSTVSTLTYDNDNIGYALSSNDKRAMRFTPSSYPANVESTTFGFYNPYNSTSDVDVVVYADRP